MRTGSRGRAGGGAVKRGRAAAGARPRKHIPIIEIAASALAEKLQTELRDTMRRERWTAKSVLRLFTPDHIQLFSWGGSDRWWNLDMRVRDASLKAKDRADTSRAAKAVRIDKKWNEFMRAVAKGRKPPKRKSAWPKHKVRLR